MLFVILQRVDDILEFIAEFTADVEGVGHVCRLVFIIVIVVTIFSFLF